ncbi:class I SAM-dependent methyltransferase [Streptomyces luteolus]|uniref:Class I SAM-dependent methyltransferase n=1 Tax=Streptomyces luteolus TaxID=3043615 RepID=A0ABT6SS99_9ACTN|nr:class I SAM-dependent methyltransferase [Streptomyces sp. B-S-A12]MDI3418013.1 class I SAM-dependent methyltransferase [Streptomyces sp. B-S-A12]
MTLSDSAAPEAGYEQRAQFYEVEYRTTVDQAFLSSLVTDSVTSILEIPCGSGRNTDWLISTGRAVTCADLEPAMVERVRERIMAAGAGDRLTAVQGDMCELDLGRRFDLILVPQEAFQLVAGAGDAERALDRLTRHLAPDGTLLLDLYSFSQDGRDGSALPDYFDPEVPDGKPVTEWRRQLQPSGWLERSRLQRAEGAHMRVDYSYRRGEGDTVHERWQSSIRLRRYSREQVEKLVGGAGLRIERMLRDYSGTPWVPGSARMITLLRPAAADQGEGK